MGGRATSKANAGAELLPLALPTTPKSRGFVAPEMATPCHATFDSDDWRFSVDWEGARAILIADKDSKVRLFDEMGRDISAAYPEITSAGLALGGRAAVLDGVVAVLDRDGRPNLELFARRNIDGSSLPAAFLASDLISAQGKSQVRKSLDERWSALHDILLPDDHIQCPDDVIGEGNALEQAAIQRGLNGVLARRRKAPYRSGVASADRLRISVNNRINVIVIAVEQSRRRESERRLVLGQALDGRVVEVGSIVCDLSAETLAWMRKVDPLTATVDYVLRSGTHEIKGAKLVTLRDDLDPLWCQYREHVDPPSDSDRPPVFGFRPTVIPALPIPD